MIVDTLVYKLVNALLNVAYELSSVDFVWNIRFPDRKGQWQHLHVIRYRQTYYLTDFTGEYGSIEWDANKGARVSRASGVVWRAKPRASVRPDGDWEHLLAAACRWLGTVLRDWVAANRRIAREYPPEYRTGTVPHGVVRALLPQVYRLDRAVGAAKTRKMVGLVEKGLFLRGDNNIVTEMSASDYLSYCRIAYLAGKGANDAAVDAALSGREMYVLNADGRHGGLLDIDQKSKQEFADWIDGRHSKHSEGGHPWEIKRGGNTTHIDLAVHRPPYRKEGYIVELRGESIGRMAETIRMFLAIHAAGLPITIARPESVRKRLLGLDNIGIVPCYDMLHRANQGFHETQDVYDVMYYSDLRRARRRIAPFITWEPISVLKPNHDDC